LERLSRDVCCRYLALHLDEPRIVAAFLLAYGGPDKALDILAAAFGVAQPILASDAPSSTLLIVPPGSAGSRLGELARSRLEPALAVIEGRPDAIVVAREAAAVP